LAAKDIGIRKRGLSLLFISNSKTFFTLMDKSGSIVKSEELPLTLECFLKAMKKVGYKAIWD
jgi:hypothetical protein